MPAAYGRHRSPAIYEPASSTEYMVNVRSLNGNVGSTIFKKSYIKSKMNIQLKDLYFHKN